MNPRITIVEDDEAMRALLLEVFSAEGYGVTALAGNETDLQSRIVRSRPELLSLDYLLPSNPSLDGMRLVDWARHEKALAGIPILILTGSLELHSQLRAIARMPNVHVLGKPFEVAALLDSVRGLLGPRSAFSDRAARRGKPPILVLDADGRIEEATTAAARLLGYSRAAELVGRTSSELAVMTPDELAAERERLQAQREWYGDLPLWRADGTVVHVSAMTTILAIGSEELRRVTLFPLPPGPRRGPTSAGDAEGSTSSSIARPDDSRVARSRR